VNLACFFKEPQIALEAEAPLSLQTKRQGLKLSRNQLHKYISFLQAELRDTVLSQSSVDGICGGQSGCGIGDVKDIRNALP
jgi:hypothetical protein